jgi:hypothetical protein
MEASKLRHINSNGRPPMEAFKLAHKSIMYIEKCVVEMFDDRSKVE